MIRKIGLTLLLFVLCTSAFAQSSNNTKIGGSWFVPAEKDTMLSLEDQFSEADLGILDRFALHHQNDDYSFVNRGRALNKVSYRILEHYYGVLDSVNVSVHSVSFSKRGEEYSMRVHGLMTVTGDQGHSSGDMLLVDSADSIIKLFKRIQEKSKERALHLWMLYFRG